MRTRIPLRVVAALLAAFTFTMQPSAQADTFGTSGNEFTIDFVNIGNAGNSADTTGYGAVPYAYRVGTYEISQDAITKATASGMANVTAGAWTGNQPAANISWYEAAAFVNWLNASIGRQPAYNLTWTGSAWSMSLWTGSDVWSLGGFNPYRHKNAYYFLPSQDEWFKAAYYDPAGSIYYRYATGSSSTPIAVASGTNAGTAVYNASFDAYFPADVAMAGGLSPYGTMGQSGNVYEWNETAAYGNNDPSGNRATRGGSWQGAENSLDARTVMYTIPEAEGWNIGFRVASVPEPSTYALLLMTGAGALWWARRRR